MKKFAVCTLLLLMLSTAVVACDDVGLGTSTQTTDGTQQGSSTTSDGEVGDPADWYEIYFTNPTCLPEDERTGGVDEIIAEDILQARLQVDVVAFDLDSEPIVNAMIELEERGIPVRVVTDEDNAELSSINRLRRNGISVREDGRSALMHNKWIVIDGRITWMGSMNFTSNGIYCNNNNIVRFDASRIAANYMAETTEMIEDERFGPTSPVNTPRETMSINGVQVENYFGPETELMPIVTQLVNEAQGQILFMAFSFTHDELGFAMINAAIEGVPVSGVFETTGSNTDFSYYKKFRESGLQNIDVRQDGNGRIMHHKVIIIDQRTVVFGSFNFSGNANDNNDENIMIVHDPTFVSFFVEEFDAVWNEAK